MQMHLGINNIYFLCCIIGSGSTFKICVQKKHLFDSRNNVSTIDCVHHRAFRGVRSHEYTVII